MRAIFIRRKRGLTLFELVTTMTIVGVMMAIIAPRFRVTEAMEVQLVAQQLAQDLEYARTRALATRTLVRVKFEVNAGRYAGYRDYSESGSISETSAERIALRGIGIRELPSAVDFDMGSASPVPNTVGSGAVTFDQNRIEYDARGLPTPMGDGGVAYLRHSRKPDKVAAVSVSPSGSVRLWTWRDGAWH